MAKRSVRVDSTSQREYIFINDSTSTTGAGKTGIAFNASGIKAYYVRPGGSATLISLVTQTVTGAYSSGGWVEVDATNMPGVYRFDIPNAVFATGAEKAIVMVSGATGMAPVVMEYELTAYDPYDTVRLGLTALPNVASGSAGAIITSGTGTAQLSVSSGNITVGGYASGQVPLQPTVAGRTLDVSTGGEAGLDWANIGSPTTTVNLSGTSTKALEPTTAGRTLDVSAGGEAGIDFANIGSPTATVNLSGTTISTSQVVASVTNRVTANTDQWNAVSVTGMPMPTYTQPTGFLTATFPTTVASPTNITSASGVTLASSQTFSTTGSVGSVTARVTANTDQLAGQTVTAAAGVTFPTSVASPTNITSASGITLAAVTHTGATIPTVSTVTAAVTVGTNNDKTGYSLTQAFPSNFAALGINVSGHISRVTLVDTTTTNTDMRGTDSAALASAWTATRAAYLDSVLLSGSANRTVKVTGTGAGHVAADLHESQAGAIHATTFDAGAIDASALAADAATEIATATLGATIEGSETLTQSVRLMRAALVGKLSGAATTTVTIRDAADSKARITATVDADGNRTAVTTDAT